MHDPDRGTLLVGVRIHSIWLTAAVWALVSLAVALAVIQWQKTGRFFVGGLPGGFAVLTYALHPRIRFFENGVEIPPTKDQHAHYLRWEQVERYHWDGDRLLLIGSNAVLAGGPAQGGAVPIPAGRRTAVEQVLAAKVQSLDFST